MNVEYHFPFGVRFWRWWCENGLKDKSAGTIGGSFMMRRLRNLYSILPGDRESCAHISLEDGRMLFVDVLDLHTYQMVLPQIKRDDQELLLAQTLSPPRGVFVDVGANVGVLSLLALSDSVAAVHSFEPNPTMMARLRKTRAASQNSGNWHLYESAVGAKIDRLSLYVDANFSGTASLNESWQGGEKGYVEVDVTTLDHLYEGGEIPMVDVVKMDVEGWEYAVLEGAGKMLRATRPYVWFEHNLPMLQRSGIDANRVLDILQELGYDTFYDIGSLPESPSYSRRDIDELSDCRVNLLAVPIERDQDFNTRVQPAMRSLSDATGA